jgi:hypothetical protein
MLKHSLHPLLDVPVAMYGCVLCFYFSLFLLVSIAETSSLLETFLGVSVVLVTNRAPLPINKRYRKE